MSEIRIAAAIQFIGVWLVCCASYGRPTYLDFRIQTARRAYLAAVARDCWSKAA